MWDHLDALGRNTGIDTVVSGGPRRGDDGVGVGDGSSQAAAEVGVASVSEVLG